MPTPDASLPYDLNGHVALITGAKHGIGTATARALASSGASVLLSYLRTSDPEDFPEREGSLCSLMLAHARWS